MNWTIRGMSNNIEGSNQNPKGFDAIERGW